MLLQSDLLVHYLGFLVPHWLVSFEIGRYMITRLFPILKIIFIIYCNSLRFSSFQLIAVVTLASAFMANFFIGLLPYVDNFSNIGGFLTGIFLGYALLYNPQLSQLERQKGIFDYDSKSSVKLKQKLDKPALRIVALLCFIAM